MIHPTCLNPLPSINYSSVIAMNPNIDGSRPVKVYFRTPSKYAKIVQLSSHISTDELYLFVSINYCLPIHNVHLFYQGKVLPPSSMVTLAETAIIHIVSLEELKKDVISVTVKFVNQDRGDCRFEVEASMLVRRFIEEKLGNPFGGNPKEAFLVHLGKQLKSGNTFRQEQIQNGSELLFVHLTQAPMLRTQSIKDEDYVIKVPFKELQTPESPKDIYPKTDFAINVPQDIDTKNSLSLIFDSKVRRASSIQNVDLDPSEIIHEEDSNFEADVTRHNQSYQSEIEVSKDRGSGFSEELSLKRHAESLQNQKLNAQQEEKDVKGGELIYSGNFHLLKNISLMGELLAASRDKVGRKLARSKND